MKWRATIAEAVYYDITVEADTEEEARELALEEHGDGLSSESDNGSPEIVDIEVVKAPSRPPAALKKIGWPRVTVRLPGGEVTGFWRESEAADLETYLEARAADTHDSSTYEARQA